MAFLSGRIGVWRSLFPLDYSSLAPLKRFHFSVDPVHVADSLGSGPFYGRLTAFTLLNLTTPVIREFDRLVNESFGQLLRLVNLLIQ